MGGVTGGGASRGQESPGSRSRVSDTEIMRPTGQKESFRFMEMSSEVCGVSGMEYNTKSSSQHTAVHIQK